MSISCQAVQYCSIEGVHLGMIVNDPCPLTACVASSCIMTLVSRKLGSYKPPAQFQLGFSVSRCPASKAPVFGSRVLLEFHWVSRNSSNVLLWGPRKLHGLQLVRSWLTQHIFLRFSMDVWTIYQHPSLLKWCSLSHHNWHTWASIHFWLFPILRQLWKFIFWAKCGGTHL